MTAIIDKKSYISHFIGFIFVLLALTDVWRYTAAMVLTSALLSMVAFIFCFPIKDRNLLSESMLFILFLLITSFVNLFFTDNGIGGSVTLLGHLLLAYTYLQADNKKITFWIILSYLITIGFISYHLFILETNPNHIYQGLSRNHAGFVVVFWTIFLLFHLKVTYNRFPIVLPLIGLVLSFFLFGRTSLIVSAILLLVVFYYKFRDSLLVRIVALSIFLGMSYYLWLKFGSILDTETNLGEGLETSRWKLWRIYIENLDFVNLFTGIDVTKLQEYNKYGGNPHNAFIKFHSRVGIGSIVFIFLFFVSIFKYLKAKQYYIFWLLILLTLRAFFDSDILVGNFDFMYYIVTFYWIKNE